MKTNLDKLILTIIAISSLSLHSCTNEVNDLTIGAPFTSKDAINGEWKLVEVIQTDLLIPAKTQTDVSDIFLASDMVIGFNSETGAYTLVSAGSGPNYIGTSGFWEFDNEEAPSSINITTTTSGLFVELGKPIRHYDEELYIKVFRKCEGKNVLSYSYKFERQ